MHNHNSIPGPEGLYDPAHEHDACGTGFVVNIAGKRSHAIVEKALQVLDNLTHRAPADAIRARATVREYWFRFRTNFSNAKRTRRASIFRSRVHTASGRFFCRSIPTGVPRVKRLSNGLSKKKASACSDGARSRSWRANAAI